MRMRISVRLTPKNNSFYDLFNQAANNNVEGAKLLAMVCGSGVDRRALTGPIRDLEHKGDEITHEVVRRLNATFVTPFDREDIYKLVGELDDVMDLMEATADLLTLYGIDELPDETLAAVQVLVKGCELTAEAMPRLKSMKNLTEYWIEMNRLENEADQLYRKTVARLFDGSYDALTVMKLKDVADQVESAVDALEDLSDTIETIVVKES